MTDLPGRPGLYALGGLGSDTLIGGSGGDMLLAGSGNDSLVGSAGNDTLYAGTGDDTLDGGTDNDLLEIDYADGTVTVIGGTGTDTLDFDWVNVDGAYVSFTGNRAGTFTFGTGESSGISSEIETIWGTTLADTVDASLDTTGVSLEMGGGDDLALGGSGADSIEGFTGNDTIVAGAGNDTIEGGTGDDVLIGGAGDDSISGGDGADFHKSGQGQDTLDGGDGDDTLMNSAGDDSLVGGAGDDLIVATQGQDTLEGGSGADTLMGGTGDDSLDGGDDDDLLLGDLAGVTFNATGTDGVGLASNITDFPATELTYEITFAASSPSASTPLISYAAGAQGNEFMLMVQPDGTLQANISGNFLDTGLDLSGMFDGKIHTFAATWDSATGALEVFVDGVSS